MVQDSAQDPADLAAHAATLVTRVVEETRALVALSTPSGEHEATEAALELCAAALPAGAVVTRPPCATPGCVPDLEVTLTGGGARRLVLLGHVDTVFSHAEHRAPQTDGKRLYGSGTIDMKAGVALALAVARACAERPDTFARLSVLLVTDEEWRTAPFAHAQRFAGYDACLCFEAGERDDQGQEGVVVQRKGAATVRVTARGRAAHAGSAPQDGRNALLALAHAAISAAAAADPQGANRLTVVPSVLRSGGATNVVPAAGELAIDARADSADAFTQLLAAIPREVDGVELESVLARVWPAMDSRSAAQPLISRAAALLGRPIVARARGGASDASHFASVIPLTVDGLGPRGAGAHTPAEFLDLGSLATRAGVALAMAQAALAA